MDTLSYKTVSINDAGVEQRWYVVDAQGKVLGRLASEIAKVIRGKHRPYFTPHVNCGDNVIVINADKVRLTGSKMSEKQYIRHTGHPGGQRTLTPEQLFERKPTEVLRKAVEGMLQRNRLRKQIMTNLYLYAGAEHPHEAQQPQPLEI